MKNIKLWKELFISFTLLFLVQADSELPEMHYIISGALNGTAAFASLENIKGNEKYLYFTFDFSFHSTSVPKSKEIAYFSVSTELNLENTSQEKIKIGFLEKSWTDINSFNDINKIKWEDIKLLYKEKLYSDTNYYYKIKRIDHKMNTLILRIPTNGNKEGSITVENILELPKFNERDLNTDI